MLKNLSSKLSVLAVVLKELDANFSMTIVSYLRLNRSRIIGAADQTTTSQSGTVYDDAIKIRKLKGANLFSYAGDSTYGTGVFQKISDDLTRDESLQDFVSMTKRAIHDVGKEYAETGADYMDFMLAGFDSDAKEFRMYYMDGNGSVRVAPRGRFVAIGHPNAVEKAMGVIKDYIEKFGDADIPPVTGFMAYLDAIDQGRRVTVGGDGVSVGTTQLVNLDSHGKIEDYSRDKTNFLTRAVRQYRKRIPHVDDAYLKRAFESILLDGMSPKNFWDGLPENVRSDIGFHTATDMSL